MADLSELRKIGSDLNGSGVKHYELPTPDDKNWSISGVASTYGLGAEVAYKIPQAPNFSVGGGGYLGGVAIVRGDWKPDALKIETNTIPTIGPIALETGPFVGLALTHGIPFVGVNVKATHLDSRWFTGVDVAAPINGYSHHHNGLPPLISFKVGRDFSF